MVDLIDDSDKLPDLPKYKQIVFNFNFKSNKYLKYGKIAFVDSRGAFALYKGGQQIHTILTENGIKYYSGLGKWIGMALFELVNDKFPDLNLKPSPLLNMLPEYQYKW